jgi:hypothetical protein
VKAGCNVLFHKPHLGRNRGADVVFSMTKADISKTSLNRDIVERKMIVGLKSESQTAER